MYLNWYCYDNHTRMANSALKCQIIMLNTARSIAVITIFQSTLGVCTTIVAIQFLLLQLWAVRPSIDHIFRHLTK